MHGFGTVQHIQTMQEREFIDSGVGWITVKIKARVLKGLIPALVNGARQCPHCACEKMSFFRQVTDPEWARSEVEKYAPKRPPARMGAGVTIVKKYDEWDFRIGNVDFVKDWDRMTECYIELLFTLNEDRMTVMDPHPWTTSGGMVFNPNCVIPGKFPFEFDWSGMPGGFIKRDEILEDLALAKEHLGAA